MNLVDAIVGIFTGTLRRHLAARKKKIEAAAEADARFVAGTYWEKFHATLAEEFSAGQRRAIGGPVKK